jgi:hypothetical protein
VIPRTFPGREAMLEAGAGGVVSFADEAAMPRLAPRYT